MRFNSQKLAEEIQDSINGVRGCIESETFAIYGDGNVQVQVRVTTNDDDFCDDITDVDFAVE